MNFPSTKHVEECIDTCADSQKTENSIILNSAPHVYFYSPQSGDATSEESGQGSEAVAQGGENSNTGADNSGGEEEEGNFSCDICKQAFRNKKYLFRHMAMHTELFKCEACGKCYSRKDSLQRHVLKCCPQMADEYSVFACEKSVELACHCPESLLLLLFGGGGGGDDNDDDDDGCSATS
jgi:hypothetical protein